MSTELEKRGSTSGAMTAEAPQAGRQARPEMNLANQHGSRHSKTPRRGSRLGRRRREAGRRASVPQTHGSPETVAVAVGAAMELQGVVAAGVAGALGLGRHVLDAAIELSAPLRAPFDAFGVTNLVRKPLEDFTDRAASLLTRLEERGREAMAAGSRATTEILGQSVDRVIGHPGSGEESSVPGLPLIVCVQARQLQ